MKCKACRTMFPDAVYNELPEKKRPAFHAHLHECESCRRQYDELKLTLGIMDEKERPQLSETDWDQFWQKLSDKIETRKVDAKAFTSWLGKIKAIFQFEPKWAVQIAGMAGILFIGILIGRFYFGAEPTGIKTTSPAFSMNAELAGTTSAYLQRSKVVLLGLVNFDPQKDDPYVLNFPEQKKISRKLVKEAFVLKRQLRQSHQEQLCRLVSDLEVILMQIANLESDYDLPAIEMVKSGVERRGIFLKINIEEMEKNQKQQMESEKNIPKNSKNKI